MPREVLTMGIDASREPADNDATAEERMEAQRQARRAVDDAYGDRGSDAEGTRRDLADLCPSRGAITDLAYHLKELPPEYAGLGATGLTVAAEPSPPTCRCCLRSRSAPVCSKKSNRHSSRGLSVGRWRA
jgi:hypothetical protein